MVNQKDENEKRQPNMHPCHDCWFYSRNYEMCRLHNIAKDLCDTCDDFKWFHGDARMRDFWDQQWVPAPRKKEAMTPKANLSEVKEAIRKVDDKYFHSITENVTSYIRDYLKMVHPEMTEDEIDDKLNLWANAWNSELVREIYEFEGLTDNLR